MAWNDRLTAVFRGHTANDHTSGSAVSIEIAVVNLTPVPVSEGEELEGSDGVIATPSASRLEIIVNCFGFRTKAQASTADYQDYSDFLELEAILRMPYKWLYRTYTIGGSAANLGHIPRAGLTGLSGSTGTDTFWNLTTDSPAGILPYPIVPSGALEPDMDNELGVAALEFKIRGRSRL